MTWGGLRSGDLRRQIVIQQRSTTKDTHGQESTSWSDVATTWAAIEPLNGRELLAAQAQQSETTHQVVIRYRTGITAANRVLYQGRVFNVLSVIDQDMKHRSLMLLCSEGLNQG